MSGCTSVVPWMLPLRKSVSPPGTRKVSSTGTPSTPCSSSGACDRGFRRYRRSRIDRHAAAVVGSADDPVGLQRRSDAARMACERLVHGVAEPCGKQMVRTILAGAADVLAGAAPPRLEPLQHL